MAKSDKNGPSTNFRTVKELILDEHKILTYVSLSKDLCIHVNEAKTILEQVVEEIKRKETNINLNVSYIISGLFNNNTARTIVCSESDLKARKDAFKIVYFQHIYSVSQGLSCMDNAAFVALNKFEDFSLCAGIIKGNSCSKRSSDEIGTLKSNSQVTIEEPKMAVTIKKENIEKTKTGLQCSHKDDKNIAMVQTTKSQLTSPKKEKLISLNVKSNGIKPKGIAGFFSKSNSAPSAKPTKAIKETVQELVVKTEHQPEIKEEFMNVDEEQTLLKNTKKEPESTKESKNKKTSSLNQIKKNAKIDKKRKRVLHVSDSESDAENDPFADAPANNESDDEIPPTPSTNTVKITSGILNPKKRRKVVDKTYTDEEGYILTRKEEVYESCSEDEDIVNKEFVQAKPEKENLKQANKGKIDVSPKQKAKNTKKKVSPPQKGKQATLTSFFKKI